MLEKGIVTVQFVPSKVSGSGKNIGKVGRKSKNNTTLTTSAEAVTIAVKEMPGATAGGVTSNEEIVGALKATWGMTTKMRANKIVIKSFKPKWNL
jgi:hypothetical protein